MSSSRWPSLPDGKFDTVKSSLCVIKVDQAIDYALHSCAGLDFQHFALITIDDQGKEKYFASASMAKMNPFPKDFTSNFRKLSDRARLEAADQEASR